jgi:hypothetical protein
MTAYRAVPYLVVAAPPVILLLAILVGGCSMTRTANDPIVDARSYSDPTNRAGNELTRELNRRATREDLQRVLDEARP